MFLYGSELPRSRVYDKATRYMHILGTDVHDCGYLDSQSRFCYYNLQNGCGSSYENDQSDYILMFSTLLVDKNGQEIFEGDIVRYGELFDLEVCRDDYNSFYMYDFISGRVLDMTSSSSDYEVISNKYYVNV